MFAPGPDGKARSCEECLGKVFDKDGRFLRERFPGEQAIRTRNECPKCDRADLQDFSPRNETKKYLDLYGRCWSEMSGFGMSVREWLDMPADMYIAFGIIHQVRYGA